MTRSACISIPVMVQMSYVKPKMLERAPERSHNIAILSQETLISPAGNFFWNTAPLLRQKLTFLPSEDSLALQKRQQNLPNFSRPTGPGWGLRPICQIACPKCHRLTPPTPHHTGIWARFEIGRFQSIGWWASAHNIKIFRPAGLLTSVIRLVWF